jgi:hypothetical protein
MIRYIKMYSTNRKNITFYEDKRSNRWLLYNENNEKHTSILILIENIYVIVLDMTTVDIYVGT